MKGMLSVKGILVVMLLMVVALGSGTALAGRQAAVSPIDTFTSTAGANIVTDSVCVEIVSKAEEGGTVKIYGSGWAPEEMILVRLIKSATSAQIVFSGDVNSAGYFEIEGTWKTNPGKTYVPSPVAGGYTLEAQGTDRPARVASAPLFFVEGKNCS